MQQIEHGLHKILVGNHRGELFLPQIHELLGHKLVGAVCVHVLCLPLILIILRDYLTVLTKIIDFSSKLWHFMRQCKNTLAKDWKILTMPQEQTQKKQEAAPEVIVIKKYANRRLYNTDTSTYVTLDDLCVMVKQGVDFTVHDAKSGEDLTRQILTQIIFEQESKGHNMLPINFLRTVIGFYDTNMRDLVPHYLEASIKTFENNQEKMREYVGGNLAGYSPFTQFEEIGKQNMAMFRRAFSMFNPFGLGEEEEKTEKRYTASTKK